jgi:hypothetical protein
VSTWVACAPRERGYRDVLYMWLTCRRRHPRRHHSGSCTQVPGTANRRGAQISFPRWLTRKSDRKAVTGDHHLSGLKLHGEPRNVDGAPVGSWAQNFPFGTDALRKHLLKVKKGAK